MAIALCARLALLNVLKLSSELHGGGTEELRPRKSCVVCSYWVDVDLATCQPITIGENFQVPPTFPPHLKRKNLYTSMCIGDETQEDSRQSI